MVATSLSLLLCAAVAAVGGSNSNVNNVESAASRGHWNAQAWQAATGSCPVPTDFPETRDANLMARSNTGVVFTDGGSRSYLASAGYMAALLELDLVKNIRYISGISAGTKLPLVEPRMHFGCISCSFSRLLNSSGPSTGPSNTSSLTPVAANEYAVVNHAPPLMPEKRPMGKGNNSQKQRQLFHPLYPESS